MAGVLSKAFSVSNDQEQAEMLNEMARELFVSCKGAQGFEQQVCYMSDHLNADGLAFIKKIHEFILLRDKEID